MPRRHDTRSCARDRTKYDMAALRPAVRTFAPAPPRCLCEEVARLATAARPVHHGNAPAFGDSVAGARSECGRGWCVSPPSRPRATRPPPFRPQSELHAPHLPPTVPPCPTPTPPPSPVGIDTKTALRRRRVLDPSRAGGGLVGTPHPPTPHPTTGGGPHAGHASAHAATPLLRPVPPAGAGTSYPPATTARPPDGRSPRRSSPRTPSTPTVPQRPAAAAPPASSHPTGGRDLLSAARRRPCSHVPCVARVWGRGEVSAMSM